MENISLHSSLIKFLDFLKEAVPAECVLLHLCDDPQTLLSSGNSALLSREEEPCFERIIRHTLRSKCPVVLPLKNNDGSLLGIENNIALERCSLFCLPLFCRDKPLGVVCLMRGSGSNPFTETNLDSVMGLIKPLYHILKNRMGCCFDSPIRDLRNGLLVGTSESHQMVMQLIDRVKSNDVPVFIWGESGTGKELAARAIHETGHRKQGKFVAVNCGAIPEYLLESELFGHVRGAFTGAMRDRIGLVDEADGGTFFLDEVGDLSFSLQSKFLRLLQEKEFRRVGDNRVRRVDVRFISATNKDLEREVARRSFREDLYYRLKIISIEIPPLRERREDILCLLNHFLAAYSREMDRERTYFSPRCLELLMNYSWPGNVREMQNEIQRCLILSEGREIIKEEHLSRWINPKGESHSPVKYNYFHAKAEFEKRFLNQALAKFQYNRSKTAEEIGISRQGLFKLIKKHKITIPVDQKEDLETAG
ncbi:MAG: sigma-54-dependent Fis family transcriptional regulator [Candidatus Aminicenantes bacterium]|nr:sigma-54-dependent Fis family transcriptional regulator [Candidatus Aminicenantes bacterium]